MSSASFTSFRKETKKENGLLLGGNVRGCTKTAQLPNKATIKMTKM
jgi:hypothetical protein